MLFLRAAVLQRNTRLTKHCKWFSLTPKQDVRGGLVRFVLFKKSSSYLVPNLQHDGCQWRLDFRAPVYTAAWEPMDSQGPGCTMAASQQGLLKALAHTRTVLTFPSLVASAAIWWVNSHRTWWPWGRAEHYAHQSRVLRYLLLKTIIFRKNNRWGSQAYLIESRQGHDGVHQVLSVQVDQHSALTSVEKMQLEGYQLC